MRPGHLGIQPRRKTAGHLSAPLLVLLSALTPACRNPARELDLSDHNLLLITVDTLRADRLGSYGYPRASTPNLDRLAKEGVRFEYAYTPVPLTLPAHSSLFTGKYPFATGVRINGRHYLEESQETLAELFRARGFRTSAFVAAYVLVSKFGLAQGFEEYEDSLRQDNIFRFYSEIRADEVYRRFHDWLQQVRDQHFFSWVHFYDPHLPYDPPPPYRERFADRPYDGEIALVDFYIGKILEDLAAGNLLDRTLVVVTSDHGEAFGEHLEEGHGLLCYDETLRVPLIFHAPRRIPDNRVVRSRVTLIDLLPTLVELFALDGNGDAHGESLLPVLAAAGEANERSLYFESLAGTDEKNWAPRSGIIARNVKLIRVPETELYDLEQDPGETRNLARSRRELTAEMEDQLQDLLRRKTETRSDGLRRLTEEDRRHLGALGYLSGTGGASRVLDPKRGIRIEMSMRSARTLAEQGSLDEAERLLEEVITENPGLEVGDFYDLRHDILAARGDTRGAISSLEEGADKFPDTALEFKLAAYLYELGQFDEAERRCREILDRDPRRSQAITLLGMIADGRGEPERALAHYEKALELEPDSIPLRIRAADTRARLGQIAQALASYEQLLAAGVLASAEDIYKAATLSSLVGDLRRAEELFRRGLELQPAGRHYISLAIIQARSGRTAQAIRSLETALSSYREDLGPRELSLAEASLRQLKGNSG